MARRSWESLSAAYRARLERKGITPGQYRSGVNLSEARGHATTPEHPREAQRNPEKYRPYIQRKSQPKPEPKGKSRSELEHEIMVRKRRVFGGAFKYRDNASDRNVRRNPATRKPAPLADLQALLRRTDRQWDDLASGQDKRWAILWYHS